MKTTIFGRWLLVALPFLLLPAVLWWYWPNPREVVYGLYRERGRSKALAGLDGYEAQSGEYVVVYFKEKDRDVAGWILETTDQAYGPVTKQLGFTPPKKVPVIVYSSRTELRSAFGWGNGESAMGVYWSGTIRLLSPNVWIHEKNEKDRRKVFDRLNPIAHELTHYVLDYYTNGNYPRWFTEGLAQRVEYKSTGYLWIESKSSLRQQLYSLPDLEDKFDALANQPLAYRQSFLLVDFMAKEFGEESLSALVRQLGQGIPFGQAVKATTGHSMGAIYADWGAWIQTNLEYLEPAS